MQFEQVDSMVFEVVNKKPPGGGDGSEADGHCASQVIQEVVDIAVAEVDLAEDAFDLLTLLATGEADLLDDVSGADQVEGAVGGPRLRRCGRRGSFRRRR